MATKQFITSKEASAFLGISLEYLYKLTHRKEIPYYKPNRKLIYFKEEDLVAWITRNRTPSNEEIEMLATNHVVLSN